MLLKYGQLWKNLTFLQHAVILLTTLVGPIVFELVQGLYATGLCRSCVNFGMLFVYVVWWQLALLVISKATSEDDTKYEKKLKEISSEFSDGIDQLREDHERRLMGNQDRVGDLNRWASDIRRVVLAELGVDLPAVPVSLRAGAIINEFRISQPEICVGRSPNVMVRIRSWVRRQTIRIWRLSRKWIWDGNGTDRSR